jgi:hypothetical protein
MATYYSDRTIAGTAGNTATRTPSRIDGRGLVHQVCAYSVATAFGASDVLQLFTVPAGAIILDGGVASGGTQGANNDAVFTVGDGGDTDRYITTSAGLVLRTGGGVVRFTALAGFVYEYSAEDTIDLLITTVGTGQTTGGYVTGWILYAMNA